MTTYTTKCAAYTQYAFCTPVPTLYWDMPSLSRRAHELRFGIIHTGDEIIIASLYALTVRYDIQYTNEVSDVW